MFAFLFLVHTVITPVATLKENTSDHSRTESQLIFSEQLKVLECSGKWAKIETIQDGYIGWLPLDTIAEETPVSGKKVFVNRLAAHVYDELDTEFGPIFTLPFESCLSVLEEPSQGDYRWIKVRLPHQKIGYIQRGDVVFEKPLLTREQMVTFSMRFLGLPYTWGGKSSFGYDCSGFVQMLYRQMGIAIPRNSRDQIKRDGFEAISLEELVPGDLIFWGKSADQINHVGMSLGNGKFIHTIASVEKMPYLRISELDGSFWNAKPSNYHCYRTARRLKKQ